MKVKDVVESTQALITLGESKFSIKAAMKIAANLRACNEVAEEFSTRRMDLFKELGEEQGAGSWKVGEENVAEFTEKVEALLNEDIDLDLKTISLEWIGDDVEVAPATLMSLEWMFTD